MPSCQWCSGVGLVVCRQCRGTGTAGGKFCPGCGGRRLQPCDRCGGTESGQSGRVHNGGAASAVPQSRRQ